MNDLGLDFISQPFFSSATPSETVQTCISPILSMMSYEWCHDGDPSGSPPAFNHGKSAQASLTVQAVQSRVARLGLEAKDVDEELSLYLKVCACVHERGALCLTHVSSRRFKNARRPCSISGQPRRLTQPLRRSSPRYQISQMIACCSY